MASGRAIEIVGARTHNLKGVSCRIPHRRVTVVTGPSGAGKSSLAFDTVFAEAQRRFVESMSTYTRQFLEQMERPPVDAIRHVLPAVALEARNPVRNARATVGTMTEIHDALRLLFVHLGEVECPDGHGPARSFTADQVAKELAGGLLGQRLTALVRIPRPRRNADVALRELIRQGYGRVLEAGGPRRMSPEERWPKELDPLPLVVARLSASSERLATVVEEGYRFGPGVLEVVGALGRRYYRLDLGCPECGRRLERPVPALLSFNSPLGACPACQGFGRLVGIDRDRVIPDPQRTLAEKPIAVWNTPAYESHYRALFAACGRRKVPLDVPWRELPPEDQEWVWSGSGPFTNLERFFAWLERRSYRVHVRVLLARYRAYTPCAACSGRRLRPEATAVLLAGETLPELAGRSVEELRQWFGKRRWRKAQLAAAGHLLERLGERLEVLDRVGLGYLTLDRAARTLSGGEMQRIHLASALGSGLTDTLFVLDEPTVGLHPQDTAALMELLHDLAGRGNTALVVEHDPALIRGADHVIDLGPSAGEEGGALLAEGPLDAILAVPESLTARFLARRPSRRARRHAGRHRRERARGRGESRVEILGARAHNLQSVDVAFPLGSLVVVTGVSGSGKSTLVEDVLYANFKRSRGAFDLEPGACRELRGLDSLDDVVLVDQRPLGRSNRSNPITYIKAYDEVRKLYASTPEAERRGIAARHFSFNLEGGRCPECQGTGEVEVDMHFMAPVRVLCDECQGRRFRPEVLAVLYRGRTIAETLALTVSEALGVFDDQPRLCRRLQSLVDVGLSYVRLGQATATLSGGEAQRLKLATFLSRSKREGRSLFLFDEPTTGLHLSDVDLLHRTLRRLLDRQDGVVVVEHNLELISRADWVVDLGPGGGVHGGRLLFSGPLDVFVDRGSGPTAEALRSYFD